MMPCMTRWVGSGLLCLSMLGLFSLQSEHSLKGQGSQVAPVQGSSGEYQAPVNMSPAKINNTALLSMRTFALQNASMPVLLRVYVQKKPSQGAAYKAQYAQYVNDSLTMWSQALNGRLRYMLVERPEHADVTVEWVSRFDDPLTAGLTYFRVGNARIQIKTVGVPDQDIKANVIHEFGHALGIGGHSPNRGDIMVAVRKWTRNSHYQPKLSAKDVAAVQRLYSSAWQPGEDLYR